MNTQQRLWFYLLLIIIFTGCGQRGAKPIETVSAPTSEMSRTISPKVQTQSPTQNHPSATKTELSTRTKEPTALSEQTGVEILAVYTSSNGFSMGSYDHLWWPPDSRTLDYYADQAYWQYSLDTKESELVPDQSLVLPTPTVVITTLLPAEAVEIGLSPSGIKALYLIPIGPLPTSLPTDPYLSGGEYWPELGNAELWLWNGEDTHQLGIIEWCANDYIWSEDEQKVILFADQLAAQCETQGWLVDLDLLEVKDLFPKERYQSAIDVWEISPNGQMVLYFGSKKLIYIKDLSTLNDTPLEIHPPSRAYWFDDNSLFVIYHHEIGQSWSLGIYDLKSSKLEELLTFDQLPELISMRPNEIEISPDRKWVAFLVGIDSYTGNSIWMMKLEVDE